jgi:hypothetical protein
MHPTPEERVAYARTLPNCPIREIDGGSRPGWRWQMVRPVAAELPMPGGMIEQPDQVPDDPQLQQWGIERWGSLVLMLDAQAQQSTGFFIGSVSDSSSTSEPPCRLAIDSYLSLVRRSSFTVQSHRGIPPESLFVATTDIPFALPDSQLGIGITARSRAGRDTLLSLLGALRFVGRSRGH